MKRIVLVLALALTLGLTGCGNMSLGLGNYTFTHVHFTDEITGYCGTVDKWYDNSNGIEVHTDEYGPMYLSEGTYMMFEDDDKCPYCSDAE